MAQPRVAVVGGGVAGTLCSLVLKNRGISPILIDAGRHAMGGRLRGMGAQFLRAADPRLATVVSMLEEQGLVGRWNGRFGMLGSSGGGFLPAEIVNQTAGYKSSKEPNEFSPATDGGDFCKFVEGSKEPTFVGLPSMADLCPRICQLAAIEQVHDTRVVGATPSRSGGWKLEVEQKSENPRPIPITEKFDALVLATHDPSVASVAVRSIAEAEIIEGGFQNYEEAMKHEDASIVIGRLMEISNTLQSARDNGKKPVYAVSLTFPKGFSDMLPFDAVSIPGSQYVQFLAKDASKPGQSSSDTADGDTWTAISTTAMADHVLSLKGANDDDKLSKATYLVSQEIVSLLSQYNGGREVDLVDVKGKRWGAAFCSPGLGLKEDSIFLAPWRLTVCGDFLRDQSVYATPLEQAALSGLEAGERTAALWTTQVGS